MLVQYPRTCFLNARGVLRGASPEHFFPSHPFVQDARCSSMPPSMLVRYPRTCFLNTRGVLRDASEGRFPPSMLVHCEGCSAAQAGIHLSACTTGCLFTS